MIRPIAICVIRHDDRILVYEARDPAKNELFYRPLGGGINFGEYGADAVAREMREEIGATISTPRYLGTLENIFTFNGQPRHELVQVYEANLLEESLYLAEELTLTEEDGNRFPVLWKRLGDFRAGTGKLYPDGLLTILG